MPTRLPNPRLAKLHRNYTVEEAARTLGVHRNTVREWIKRGLPTTDRKRPLLILGRELVAFLTAKRARNKRKCEPGEIYCVRCRAPRGPALGMAEYQPLTATHGNLVGFCPSCETLMYRRVNLAKLPVVRGSLEVTLPEAASRLGESRQTSAICDLSEEAVTHADAPSE